MALTRLMMACAVICTAAACSGNTFLSSPDGNIAVGQTLSDEGVSVLRVSAYGGEVMEISAAGLVAVEGDLCSGLEIVDIDSGRVAETWTQPWGENKTVIDRHREMAVTMKNQSGTVLTLRIRAFDDGIGFRYEYETGHDSLTVMAENTRFSFVNDGVSWSIPGNFETYELDTRELPVSSVETANTPFTFHVGNVWGSIHEAALYDYPEMNLYQCDSLTFRTELAPRLDGSKARVPGKFSTPWRTVQFADRAVDLINSSLVLNLNEPCAIDDVSWIRPQKYVGVWWGMHLGTQTWTDGPRHGATTENAIRHIDFAAENNIDGVLFEGWNRGWENWGGSQHFDYCEASPEFDLEKVAAYAREKGVSLWAHNETGGSIFEYEVALDSAFAKYESLGIHVLKTGYAGGMPGNIRHHSQRAVQHYQKVVEKAAEHELMLNVHEPVKETGIRRTWPNMMTREGAKGMEWNAWSRGNSSEYLCTVPFVRLLSGPVDYTPGVFDIYYERAAADPGRIAWNGDNSQCYIKTTLARQIANWVILYSPLQMACDLIENYEGHPAFQFFRDFDPDSDWSEALAGEPGDFIVVARRAGERYFLGAGTNHEARTVSVPLDFLDPGTVYNAEIYADDPDAPVIVQPDGTRAPDKTAFRILSADVTASDTLHVAMSADGGQAIVFKPSADNILEDNAEANVGNNEGWTITALDFNCPEYAGVPVANGRLGILPWKEPFSVRHIILNNVSERLGDDGVNRIVRGINPFGLAMNVDGRWEWDISYWRQTIDMKNARHITEFVADRKVKVRYSIAALRNLPYSMLMDVEVTALDEADVEFVNRMSVPHDEYGETSGQRRSLWIENRSIDVLMVSAPTVSGRYEVAAASAFIPGNGDFSRSGNSDEDRISFSLPQGRSCHFTLAASVCSTADFSDPWNEAVRQLVHMDRMTVDAVWDGHERSWAELWKGDIEIDGDLEAQRAVRLALFSLYGSCRKGSGLSIPPMGLSSQGYNGHIFWDAEMWMFPPLLLLNQDLAESMMDYRTDRTDAAERRAAAWGYDGMMFPWESDAFGEESTPVWALTGPMEHHITADVGIAAWNYWRVTRDMEWLKDKGWPLLKGIAEFWTSRVTENVDGSWSIDGVVGADEYAINVTDNAFTNGAVRQVLKYADKAARLCGEKAPSEWKSISDGLRILRDADGTVKEYEGYDGRKIKQADVNLLGYPLGVVTDRRQLLRDLEYYEDKVDPVDGPAMTWSIFCVQYARLGDAGRAEEMFHRCYRSFSRPPFGALAETPSSDNPYFVTGAGGLLQAVLFGFGGLDITDSGIVQRPSVLPSSWKSLTIRGVGPERKTVVLRR